MTKDLPRPPRSALILSGGGARAAYQVGVLKALMEILPPDCGNPFPILCGTSAGAINSGVLACYASRFRIGVRRLERVWSNFHSQQIFLSDRAGMMSNSLRWLAHIFFSVGEPNSVALLDNSPLRALLQQVMPFERIADAITAGDLHAVALTASGYTSGESITFFQAVAEVASWQRHRRAGARAHIGIDHVMASAALPLLFQAVRVNREYFGDGSMRFHAPISPALHLGAEQVMVIGVGPKSTLPPERHAMGVPPTVAQVAGHILDSIFFDGLQGDLERLERVNDMIALATVDELRQHSIPLRPIKTLVLTPSEDISQIAGHHAKSIPAGLRFVLKRIGASGTSASTVLSYLMFEASFCQDLIALGYEDAKRKEESIAIFFAHLFTARQPSSS